MLMRRIFPLFAFVVCALAATWSTHAQVAQNVPPPDAPPLTCTSTFGQWCGVQGISAVIRRQDEVSTLVELRPSEPRSYEESLFVISPATCSRGYADQLTFAGFTLDTPFSSGRKDALEVRLSATCSITVLLPKWSGDPLDWPYRTGLGLLRSCTNRSCEGFSFGLLQNRFEIKYRRQLIRP